MAESQTLRPTLDKVLERFPIRRVIAVADRSLMSRDNLEELKSIQTPAGEPLEFILAVPGRRYGEFESLLSGFHREQCLDASEEVIGERAWQGRRLIVAHNPQTAAKRTAARDGQIKLLEDRAADWADELNTQEGRKRYRGR